MSGVATLELRRDIVRNHFLGLTPVYNRLEVALTRKVPASNAALSQLDEPTGLGYARVTAQLTGTYWALGPSDEIVLNAALTFPAATGAWGTINGWALLSASTVGGYTQTVLALGTVPLPLRVVSGVQPRLPVGAISFAALDT